MKTTATVLCALACLASAAPLEAQPILPRATPAPGGNAKGFDVSDAQASVDFQSAKNSGASFVIIKATEGGTFIAKSYATKSQQAAQAGLIQGAYHFARPDGSSGATNANFFLAHGGAWNNDGMTLPGSVDLESTKGKPTCYGLSTSAMVSWIQDFVDTYQASTGRYPMIYSNPGWWSQCTGNSNAFASTCPLWLSRYAASPGTLPGGWGQYQLWQNANGGYQYGGDPDIWNGDVSSLQAFATSG